MKFDVTLEQKIVAIYMILGAVFGFFSGYLTAVDLTLALLMPTVCYFATLFPLVKFVKERKIRMIVSNSMITFFLVWIMVWVFLYNL